MPGITLLLLYMYQMAFYALNEEFAFWEAVVTLAHTDKGQRHNVKIFDVKPPVKCSGFPFKIQRKPQCTKHSATLITQSGSSSDSW